MLNVYNMLVFLTNLVPVWALLLDQTRLKGKHWFILVETTIFCSAVTLLLTFHNWRWYGLSNIVWSLYFFEVGVMFILFTRRFGYEKVHRSLSLSLLMVYVLTEVHEWAAFVLDDYLHFFVDPYTVLAGDVPTWMRLLSNLYVVVAFVILVYKSGLKRSWKNVLLLSASMTIPAVFLMYDPTVYLYLHLFKRALLFTCWATIFYFQTNPTSSSGVGGKNVLPKV